MKDPLPFKQTFFGALPVELREMIFSHLKGPALEVIEDEASDTQKAKVLALESYHLIIKIENKNQQLYLLGFCKKNTAGHMEYVTKRLDEKSAFYRVITEDPELISKLKKTSKLDRFTLHYLEEAIRLAWGIVKPHGFDKVRVAGVCQALRAEMRGGAQAIKKELFHDFLFYVALGRQGRVKSILKQFPEFMLSEHKDDVKSVSEELTFHNTTAFKLAVRNCDWHMYHMMLKYVPKDEREEKFRIDLHQQLEELEQKGLPYTLDNLSVCGLRVLEAGQQEPTEKQTQTAREGNAYHLILHRNARNVITNAELGFRDSNGEYRRLLLPEGELRDFILNAKNASLFRPILYALSHKIVRNKKILRLAEQAINTLGGETKRFDNKSLEGHIDLLASACEAYMRLCDNGSFIESTEQWCVVIGRLQRLCFAAPNLAGYSMIRGRDFKGRVHPGGPFFGDGRPLFPFESFFADSYALNAGGRCRGMCNYSSFRAAGLAGGRFLAFLNNFYQVACENLQRLNDTLQPRTNLGAAL